MTDKELLQQALDALKMSYELQDNGLINFEEYKLISDADILIKLQITIEAIKARLAQPDGVQGEVRVQIHTGDGWIRDSQLEAVIATGWVRSLLQKKELVGLTDEEVNNILKLSKNAYDAAKRIEAKLKEKNT